MSQTFRVLLVEDDDSLRSCLGEFLTGLGWDVAATPRGLEAMALARRQRFDFSLLDFHLPEMTGLELFQRLGAIRPLPAILMSGLATAEEASAARRAGFFAFLRKPLELERLRQSMQQLIATHFGGPLARISTAAPPRPAQPAPATPAATTADAPRPRAPRRRPR